MRKELESAVRRLIANYVMPERAPVADVRIIVGSYDLLPVYFDMFYCLAIGPDLNTFKIEWSADSATGEVGEPEPTSGNREGDMIRILAAQRFPELSGLLPERTTNAEDCASCEGTGMERSQRVPCITCHGLKWVPEDWGP